jgi:hypothetical protein
MPLGIPRSEETRRKISIAQLGKPHPKKGHPLSLESREKIGLKMRGVPKTDSHRLNISLGLKRIYSGTSRKLENCPAWKGGISFEPYCPKFNDEFKERVRAFFNHTCQMCGHVWQPGKRKLSVHHVNYDKMVCCNDVKPLFVCLCPSTCHTKTNGNRKYWEDYFTNKIMSEYGGQSWIEGMFNDET